MQVPLSMCNVPGPPFVAGYTQLAVALQVQMLLLQHRPSVGPIWDAAGPHLEVVAGDGVVGVEHDEVVEVGAALGRLGGLGVQRVRHDAPCARQGFTGFTP